MPKFFMPKPKKTLPLKSVNNSVNKFDLTNQSNARQNTLKYVSRNYSIVILGFFRAKSRFFDAFADYEF